MNKCSTVQPSINKGMNRTVIIEHITLRNVNINNAKVKGSETSMIIFYVHFK